MAKDPTIWERAMEDFIFYEGFRIRDHFWIGQEEDGSWSIYRTVKVKGCSNLAVKEGSIPFVSGFASYNECQSNYSYLCHLANDYVRQGRAKMSKQQDSKKSVTKGRKSEKSTSPASSKVHEVHPVKKKKKMKRPPVQKSGWLMSLSHSPDKEPESQWGDVVSFFEEMESAPVKKGKYIIDAWVWGRIAKKDETLEKGDQVAFYHSTSARFRPRDPHQRKSRISLVGELVDVKEIADREWNVTIAIDKQVLKYMKDHPIVRDGELVKLFETCGIKQGNVAAFYYAPPKAWQKIQSLATSR